MSLTLLNAQPFCAAAGHSLIAAARQVKSWHCAQVTGAGAVTFKASGKKRISVGEALGHRFMAQVRHTGCLAPLSACPAHASHLCCFRGSCTPRAWHARQQSRAEKLQ